MNEIRIKGRLTADPEIRYTTGATPVPVASFSVAVNRRFKKDVADFINCQAWNKTAELMEKHFKKGQEILVGGELQCSQYTDKDGNKRNDWRVQVEWVEFCGSANNGQQATQQAIPTTMNVPKDTAFVPADIDLEDEDLPF